MTSSLFAFPHSELRLGSQLCFSAPLGASVQNQAKALTDPRWPISNKLCLSDCPFPSSLELWPAAWGAHRVGFPSVGPPEPPAGCLFSHAQAHCLQKQGGKERRRRQVAAPGAWKDTPWCWYALFQAVLVFCKTFCKLFLPSGLGGIVPTKHASETSHCATAKQ